MNFGVRSKKLCLFCFVSKVCHLTVHGNCICRHFRLEAELNTMNWRVKWEDIMLGTIEGDRKMKKQAASNLSLARVSAGTSLTSSTHRKHVTDSGTSCPFRR